MKTKSRFNRNTLDGSRHKLEFKVGMLLFLVLVFILEACAMGGVYFQRSHDLAAQFEQGQVLEGYRYYVGGPAAKPNAIVALKEAYNLESEHWTSFTATPDLLKKEVNRVKYVIGAEFKEQQMISNGARIMDNNGNQIGIWYSVYDYSQIKLLEGHRVYISYPQARLPLDVKTSRF